ncbi:TPA: SMI1/KNR4 family protein [Vibrio parahaemolyticus]|uniref:SMI1/KNR4 family protein n=1 Tax=Vibrio parahaemolyticus TaxID=670 RepID=UPI0010DE5F68|nr:SMI1/KNR4 family protein [Vibrio parahaemolyticus]MEA5231123.1 SMI1/KNR4 family protein [Vibrio parahaemolyticus]TBT50721.1 SMI1/KNR4 family protein [Vibrio parahaemolyticus]HCH1182873.1 SMI1/KNR4 family protein [Vibrio parahaemolyticus]
MYDLFNSMIDSMIECTRKKRYTIDDIVSFEGILGYELPETYREFLVKVGTFKYTDNEFGFIFELLNLESIEEWTKSVCKASGTVFPELLLIASSTSGEHFGLKATSKQLYVFDPECPVELWASEHLKEYVFNDWLAVLLNERFEEVW